MRVGVIGTGTMGNAHAAAYRRIPGVELAGVASRSTEIKPEQLLADPSVELVSICLPTHLHVPYATAAARAGKHVICEKPLARTLADADAIIDACRAAGVRLFVGHTLRFSPDWALGRAQVLGGAVGNPGVARTRRVAPFPAGRDDWFADHGISGGVLLDLMIHDFDWLRWTFGEVQRVYALSTRGRGADRADYALVLLRFASGVVAHAEGSWAHPAFNHGFDVAGDRGYLEYRMDRSVPLSISRRGDEAAERARVAVPESPLAEDPYTAQIRHFVECLRTGAEPLVTPADARAALAIALAAETSARTRQPVALEGGGAR